MTATGAIEATGARDAPAGPWWWPRRRSAVLDVSLAVVSTLETVVEGLDFAGDAGLPSWTGLLLGLVVGPVLLLRRRWPVAVVLVSIAVTPTQMGALLSIVGLYSLAVSDVPRRALGLLAGMSVIGTLVSSFFSLRQDLLNEPGFRPPTWFMLVMAVAVGLIVTAPPVLWGLYVGARRRLVESLRERADGLERELSLLADRAEERAEWARNEERTRIAREMHDVVAHRVSLMVVHAAALQAVALKDPEKASRNAGLVGDMGRQALTELREMLGVLRNGEGASGRSSAPVSGEPERLVAVASKVKANAEAGEAASGADARAAGPVGSGGVRGAGPRSGARVAEAGAGDRARGGAAVVTAEPEGGEGPSLAELGDLVGQSRAAGMAVELSVDGAAVESGYPSGVEQTVYRVVQEALTNVHKHAPGARARVRLAYREGEVAVQVENGPSAGGAVDVGLPSGGNGLVGMRERVTGLGGVFVSGPTEAGGFRVSAVLPGRQVEG
ncbi:MULTISPECIES: sensor histidine kinase [Streptomyces]|uniref:histidine kinase n=1 Tax=Streptomyces rimosus subsp. rimosus (strain ATCC 10970 / DSM 40260 / JCM 4667 / NRRL 2234) TaxID=1265868 RepID=A0A8A1USD8_STRR1|nr:MULTISPECIES: histidine kinase [Streptomyces]MYT46612.1 sensor histidine kinase [Streptomyces sp. SID5471]QDA06442.1 sensor histidine kinase [Streptomyces rimosus]QEV77716.1 sensor histidine kinase [Streptomyces rimosus]QGY64594.1 sensor histidine kinase [Streptomyces rimosus R6-500]QST81534.1 sensor histidine kinase [Streptomyces rimosus subsp. rimosus ATCC 10970]